jgi:hypothetical protein
MFLLYVPCETLVKDRDFPCVVSFLHPEFFLTLERETREHYPRFQYKLESFFHPAIIVYTTVAFTTPPSLCWVIAIYLRGLLICSNTQVYHFVNFSMKMSKLLEKAPSVIIDCI